MLRDLIVQLPTANIATTVISAATIVILYVCKNHIAPRLTRFTKIPVPFDLFAVSASAFFIERYIIAYSQVMINNRLKPVGVQICFLSLFSVLKAFLSIQFFTSCNEGSPLI